MGLFPSCGFNTPWWLTCIWSFLWGGYARGFFLIVSPDYLAAAVSDVTLTLSIPRTLVAQPPRSMLRQVFEVEGVLSAKGISVL